MNSIQFQYILAYFQAYENKQKQKRWKTFWKNQQALESLARAGQPFGGRIF
ncbi:MAG: hypothetical protein ACK4GN_07285 [Runella sp.]